MEQSDTKNSSFEQCLIRLISEDRPELTPSFTLGALKTISPEAAVIVYVHRPDLREHFSPEIKKLGETELAKRRAEIVKSQVVTRAVVNGVVNEFL